MQSSPCEWRSSSPDGCADFNVLAEAEKLLVGRLAARRSSLFTNLEPNISQSTTDRPDKHSDLVNEKSTVHNATTLPLRRDRRSPRAPLTTPRRPKHPNPLPRHWRNRPLNRPDHRRRHHGGRRVRAQWHRRHRHRRAKERHTERRCGCEIGLELC